MKVCARVAKNRSSSISLLREASWFYGFVGFSCWMAYCKGPEVPEPKHAQQEQVAQRTYFETL